MRTPNKAVEENGCSAIADCMVPIWISDFPLRLLRPAN
jgi:hypothetical protein